MANDIGKTKWLGLVIMVLSTPAILAMILLPRYLQSALCPAGTLLSGPLKGLGIGLGALFFGIGVTLAGGGTFWENSEKTPTEQRRYGSILRSCAIVMAICSAAVWAEDLFNYYCAVPGSVIAHPGLFVSPVMYHPQDIQSVSAGCNYTRSGMSVHFTVAMRDGRQLDLGNSEWSKLQKNYRGITAALLPSNYRYDNEAADCPQELQNLFAPRPH